MSEDHMSIDVTEKGAVEHSVPDPMWPMRGEGTLVDPHPTKAENSLTTLGGDIKKPTLEVDVGVEVYFQGCVYVIESVSLDKYEHGTNLALSCITKVERAVRKQMAKGKELTNAPLMSIEKKSH